MLFHCGLDEDEDALVAAVPEAATFSVDAGAPLIAKARETRARGRRRAAAAARPRLSPFPPPFPSRF